MNVPLFTRLAMLVMHPISEPEIRTSRPSNTECGICSVSRFGKKYLHMLWRSFCCYFTCWLMLSQQEGKLWTKRLDQANAALCNSFCALKIMVDSERLLKWSITFAVFLSFTTRREIPLWAGYSNEGGFYRESRICGCSAASLLG